MPTTPRLDSPTPVTETSGFRSPEEEELRRKQSELEGLQSELAESEVELATLRSELIAFERRYLEVVGSRYAELDALEAQIVEAVQRARPDGVLPLETFSSPCGWGRFVGQSFQMAADTL